MRRPRTAAVIGAGLSGLTAAYRLAAAGVRVTLLDAANRTGGWVSTRRHKVAFEDEVSRNRVEGEVVLEAGPRSIRPKGPSAPAMLQLISDIGLAPDILPIPSTHPAARNRYLLDPRTGALERAGVSLTGTPAGVRALIKGALVEPFRSRKSDREDESVASFFSRRFGPDAAGVASAFVHGIYAADPDALSVRSAFGILPAAEEKYGSVVLGMLLGARSKEEREAERKAWEAVGPLGMERKDWSMYALQGGMQSLTDRLEARVIAAGGEVRLGTEVWRVEKAEDGVHVRTPSTTLTVDHVVAALPPRRLHSVLSTPPPHLRANSTTTVGVVNVVYALPPSAIHPEGFGYLIPHTAGDWNPEGALGVVFDSTALPGMDGGLEGRVTKLTVMMGGPHWGSYNNSSPPAEADLAPLALAHLGRVFPQLAAVEPLLVVPNLNKECIPTYSPGHRDRLAETHAALAGSGVSVVGAGYAGVSVNDCVHFADQVARGLVAGQPVTGLETLAK